MNKLKDLQAKVKGLKKPGEAAPAKLRKAKKADDPPAEKKTVGRPTVVTTEAVAKLEYAFALGCSDLEACFYADISRDALYDYQRLNPEFTDRKAALKKRPILLAREVIVDALVEKDRNSAHKVLDREEGTKTVIAGDPDNPIRTVSRIELVPLVPK